MARVRTCLLCGLLVMSVAPGAVRIGSSAQAAATIAVRVGASVTRDTIDGRLLLLIATDGSREPRFQVSGTSVTTIT